jgi:hypothetical protein
MSTAHIEFLAEEPSIEAFLRTMLPRFFSQEKFFEVHAFQGKSDLLAKLEGRLRGYAAWMPPEWRIVVVVDRDNDDCRELKARLEGFAAQANLRTKTKSGTHQWQLVNRIVIEELEAWYFSDWEAVLAAYPRVARNIPSKERFRDSDAIAGGTWEAFESTLQKYSYFSGGLPKIEAARMIGLYFDPVRSRSASFKAFWSAISEVFV